MGDLYQKLLSKGGVELSSLPGKGRGARWGRLGPGAGSAEAPATSAWLWRHREVRNSGISTLTGSDWDFTAL